jgi:hypothetical protein
MSMNNTVMRRLSSRLVGASAESAGAPHDVQKEASIANVRPQWTQARVKRVPQPPQNLSSGPATREQLVQVEVFTSPPGHAERSVLPSQRNDGTGEATV